MEIFVGNLPFDITEQEIRDKFAEIGAVSNVKMLMDKFSGRFRGIAFVSMDDQAQAEKAVETLNGADLGGRPMKVDRSRERSERDFPTAAASDSTATVRNARSVRDSAGATTKTADKTRKTAITSNNAKTSAGKVSARGRKAFVQDKAVLDRDRTASVRETAASIKDSTTTTTANATTTVAPPEKTTTQANNSDNKKRRSITIAFFVCIPFGVRKHDRL